MTKSDAAMRIGVLLSDAPKAWGLPYGGDLLQLVRSRDHDSSELWRGRLPLYTSGLSVFRGRRSAARFRDPTCAVHRAGDAGGGLRTSCTLYPRRRQAAHLVLCL